MKRSKHCKHGTLPNAQESNDRHGDASHNIALQIAYDGTNFVGSQWQTNGRSVQGALEESWLMFAQEQRRFVLAGRTDAGVHARGQVANVRTAIAREPAVIQRAMNALLPDDVVVMGVARVPDSFHARRSALWRTYYYFIENAPVPLPTLRHSVLHVRQPLDISAMESALGMLPGRHDFATFGTADDNRSTVRECYQATCGIIEVFDRPVLRIMIVANGFLRHMVRAIVGTLLLVGQAQLTEDEFWQKFQACDRRCSGPTAPAHGLLLADVGYPDDIILFATDIHETKGIDENLLTKNFGSPP